MHHAQRVREIKLMAAALLRRAVIERQLLTELFDAANYVHRDLLLRAEIEDGQSVVAIGDGAWSGLCLALAKVDEARAALSNEESNDD